MYWIIGSDNNEYGPLDETVVQQWIREKRIYANTRVKTDQNADWQLLSDRPEFKTFLQAQAPAPQPAASSLPPRPDAKTSRLAVTALVLAVLSPFTLGLTALIGLILGVVALIKINQSQGHLKGKGLAIGSICGAGLMLVLVPIVAILAGLMLPALSQAKDRAMRINCVSNMKMIGLGMRMYANDYNDTFPPSLLALTNELPNPKVLICPLDRGKVDLTTLSWENLDPQQISYEFLAPKGDERALAREVVLRCRHHNNVGYGDGSAQMQPGNSRR